MAVICPSVIMAGPAQPRQQQVTFPLGFVPALPWAGGHIWASDCGTWASTGMVALPGLPHPDLTLSPSKSRLLTLQGVVSLYKG